jgi:hypothetical protein
LQRLGIKAVKAQGEDNNSRKKAQRTQKKATLIDICLCGRSAELRTFGELSRVAEAFVTLL